MTPGDGVAEAEYDGGYGLALKVADQWRQWHKSKHKYSDLDVNPISYMYNNGIVYCIGKRASEIFPLVHPYSTVYIPLNLLSAQGAPIGSFYPQMLP